jgi:cytochrome P450
MDFVPPYPHRPAAALPILTLLRTARRNLLEIWEDKAFEYEMFSARLLTRRVFVCNSPDTVRFAFVDHNDDFERKSPQMRTALRPLLGDGLFISDGPVWRSRRKMVAPLIHASRVADFAPTMIETAAETADRWEQSPQPARIDALTQMAAMTAEIICRTIFGRRLGHAHASAIVDGFSDYQHRIEQLDMMSLFGLPEWMPRLHGRGIAASTRRIHAVLDRIIDSHVRAGDSGEVSMIRQLAQSRGPEDGGARLSAEALRNEAAVLFMAGHETTANSLAWTWYLLSQSPRVEARLHAELDAVLGGEPPGYEDFARLPYTRAVFEETLRLYPPVPVLSREALRDTRLRSKTVRAGSLVMAVPWLLHRHRKLWDRPDHFIPERFLPENSEARPKYVYIPFSIGPRICAGAAFGLTEAVLCLATLAQRFTLRLDRPGPVMPVCRLSIRPQGGLPMIVTPRRR